MSSAPLHPRDLLNAAGLLTLSRIPLAVTSSLVKHDPLWLGLTLLAFIFTDVIDGPVARRTGTASRAGAVADGWADKIFLINFAWCLELAGWIPIAYLVPWFIREALQAVSIPAVALSYARAEAAAPEPVASGKVCTVAVTFAMVAALAEATVALNLLTAVAAVTGAHSGMSYLLRDRFWRRWTAPGSSSTAPPPHSPQDRAGG